jgi:hypothetical protein
MKALFTALFLVAFATFATCQLQYTSKAVFTAGMESTYYGQAYNPSPIKSFVNLSIEKQITEDFSMTAGVSAFILPNFNFHGFEPSTTICFSQQRLGRFVGGIGYRVITNSSLDEFTNKFDGISLIAMYQRNFAKWYRISVGVTSRPVEQIRGFTRGMENNYQLSFSRIF